MRHIIYIGAMALTSAFWSCETVDLSDVNNSSTSGANVDTCYIWNGHIVVNEKRSDSGGIELLLLSLYEWSDMPSANHVTDSTLARVVAERYQEMDLCEWHVPTQEEAKYLRTNYESGSVSLERLNTVLAENDALVVSGDARYLCNEGRKSFSFAPGTSIANAGSKTKTYRLRLVKRVGGDDDDRK